MADRSSDVSDDLMRAVVMAADSAAIDASQLQGVVNADITRAAVRAAFECALGNGLIELVPQEQWPEWIAVYPPYKPTFPGAGS